MKDMTPAHLRCTFGASCPSVHQLEDGRLLIVGRRAEPDEANIGPGGCTVIGNGEVGAVIDLALLSGIKHLIP